MVSRGIKGLNKVDQVATYLKRHSGVSDELQIVDRTRTAQAETVNSKNDLCLNSSGQSREPIEILLLLLNLPDGHVA